MLLFLAALVAGFFFLIFSADFFVKGTSAIARNLGVPPLIIGLTIVGLGTSAPEMLVAGMASIQGNTGLATGNAIGSNIANIGLVLGATALTITHDMSSAKKIGDRIAMLFDGKVIWAGPPSAVDDSGNDCLDQFIHGRTSGPIKMALRA